MPVGEVRLAEAVPNAGVVVVLEGGEMSAEGVERVSDILILENIGRVIVRVSTLQEQDVLPRGEGQFLTIEEEFNPCHVRLSLALV